MKLYVLKEGTRYEAECEPLSRDSVKMALTTWRGDLETIGDQCSDRIRLACSERWNWEGFTYAQTDRVFGLFASDISPHCLGMLSADEDGRMLRGGLAINIHDVSKSPFAYVKRISHIGTSLVARALRWSKEDPDLRGRAVIRSALGPHISNRDDNPSAAYFKMGFRATLMALNDVSCVQMEISEQGANDLLGRFDDGR